jgi:ABC-2 type transport system permease protein
VPLAALIVGTGSWLVFAKATEAGLYALGFDRTGASAYPAILALYGMVFTGIGLLAGQFAQGARGAYVLGAVLVVAGFAGRAFVDGRQLRHTWVSPMSWVAESHPWGTWVWWPALSFVALEAVAVAAALLIAARRDLGSGVLPQRLGPSGASAVLATPAGLAWRLTRGTTFGWTTGAVIWCGSLGLMADEMARIIRANPTLAEALGDDPGQVVSVMSLVITGIVAGATGVAATSRFGAEEQSARIGLALAGAVSRVRMWMVWTGVAVASALATLFAGGLALGLAQWVSGGARSTVGRELRAAGAYAAPVVLVTVSAGLLVALSPRLRGVAWLPLGWFAVVGLMAEALRLPRWSRDLSPYELVGRVPLESLDRDAWGWLALGAAVAVAASTVRFCSRSLVRG